MDTIKQYLTLHTKVSAGLIAAVILVFITPWLQKQGVNVDPSDPNVKVFLTLLASWAAPSGGPSA